MGALLGCVIEIILGVFFRISQLYSASLGARIGYLFGFSAYEFYSKEGNDIFYNSRVCCRENVFKKSR